MMNKIVFLRFIFIGIISLQFVNVCIGEDGKKGVEENRDDNGETNDETKDESLEIPADSEPNITCSRKQNSQVHEIRSAQSKQFPFMAAVMSSTNEYLCSGSVVSNGLILTTATCTQLPINYVLLNTTKDKKDETTVMLHIIKTEKFPTYPGTDSMKDVGLIYTEKHNNSVASKIKLSNYTNARNLNELEGIGFGLNSEVGQSKELQYIGMELRQHFEGSEILKGYFDCVDTKVLTCYKDNGGPIINDNELIGIVVKGQDECTREMSSTYAINKRMVDFLPTYTFKAWLDERIKKNEEQEESALPTFPVQPSLRSPVYKMTKGSAVRLPAISIHIFILNLCSMLDLF